MSNPPLFLFLILMATVAQHRVAHADLFDNVPAPPADSRPLAPIDDGADGLLYATVIYRHGQRTPFLPYPNDPYASSSFFPTGWGQLTAEGRRQLFELGTWLRRRYLGRVLRERYSGEDIRIESTDVERTLQSAAICTAGMFPPGEEDRWDAEGGEGRGDTLSATFQPVAIHTAPFHLDDRIACGRRCAAFEHYFDEAQRQLFAHYHGRHEHLMAYVAKHSGSPVQTVAQVWSVFDSLQVQQEHNLTLPAWTRRVFPHDGPLRQVALESFTVQTRNSPMSRVKFGWLLRDVLRGFEAKAAGLTKPARRTMSVYSAHDATIVGLLNTMGMFDWKFVPYAGAMMFELHRQNGTAYVQIVYRNSTVVEPQPMEIPECGTLCPLERMFEIFADVLPTGSWDEECAWPPVVGRPSKRSSGSELRADKWWWIVALVAGVAYVAQ